MHVIVVCHTEYGYVKNKEVIYEEKGVDGVRRGVHNLIAIADRYGAKITFVVMPETAEHFPKNVGKHEVGLHIHSGWVEKRYKTFRWYVGDKYLMEHCKVSVNSAFLQDLNYKDQLTLIETGKDYLCDIFKVDPRVFVAGRWSENNDTVNALVNAGFTHDLSACPYQKSSSTSDWSKLPRICMPYHPSIENYQEKGDLPLWIVPVSQFFPFGNVSPEEVPYVGLSSLKACFLEYYKQNLPLFHIYLHSPSMTDIWFCSIVDELLSFISKRNVQFIVASQITDYGKTNPRTDLFPYLARPDGGFIRILTRLKKMKASLTKETLMTEIPRAYSSRNT
ncbi:MAG: PTS alpha-glucoside transporter subunit IIBC [Candidatus Bathyarchaeia archaeon]